MTVPDVLSDGGVVTINHEPVPDGGVRALPVLVAMLSLAMTIGPINGMAH